MPSLKRKVTLPAANRTKPAAKQFRTVVGAAPKAIVTAPFQRAPVFVGGPPPVTTWAFADNKYKNIARNPAAQAQLKLLTALGKKMGGPAQHTKKTGARQFNEDPQAFWKRATAEAAATAMNTYGVDLYNKKDLEGYNKRVEDNKIRGPMIEMSSDGKTLTKMSGVSKDDVDPGTEAGRANITKLGLTGRGRKRGRKKPRPKPHVCRKHCICKYRRR